jgi:hypothetical protein
MIFAGRPSGGVSVAVVLVAATPDETVWIDGHQAIVAGLSVSRVGVLIKPWKPI